MSIDIKALREKLGTDGKAISQGELAEKLGVSQSTVSRLETGEIEADGPLAIVLRQLFETSRQAAA